MYASDWYTSVSDIRARLRGLSKTDSNSAMTTAGIEKLKALSGVVVEMQGE
jgi:hypothetical protein